jgi:hypothetical protein
MLAAEHLKGNGGLARLSGPRDEHHLLGEIPGDLLSEVPVTHRPQNLSACEITGKHFHLGVKIMDPTRNGPRAAAPGR